MPRIFISYRRVDSRDIAARIYDRLIEQFDVFKDSYSIPPGADFRGVIREEIAKCDVLLAVIGPQWLSEIQRRATMPDDWVRIEIESGLQSGSMKVIPVIVGGATMPDAADLPDTLRELAFRNAVFLRDDPDFHRDMDAFVADHLEPPRRRGWLGLAVSLLLLVAVLVAGWALFFQPDAPVDVAYAFLVDSSEYMNAELPGSEQSRYAVAQQTIFDIVNAAGTVNESTWVGLRTAGGDSACRQTDLASEFSGGRFDGSAARAFIEPLESARPYGYTAYNEGFRAVMDDLQRPDDGKVRLVFAFLGATQESPECGLGFHPAVIADNFESSGIDVLMCAFTFFDDPAVFDTFRRDFNEAVGPCVFNAQNADQAALWVSIARQQIQQAQAQADGIIEETLVVDLPPLPDGATAIPTPVTTPTPTTTLLPTSTPTPTQTATQPPADVEMRSGPGLHFDVAGSFPADTPLTYVAVNEARDWLQVELEDGTTGWISIAGLGANQLSGINDLPVFLPTATSTDTPTSTTAPLVTGIQLTAPGSARVAESFQVELTMFLSTTSDDIIGTRLTGIDLDNFGVADTLSGGQRANSAILTTRWTLIPEAGAAGTHIIGVEVFLSVEQPDGTLADEVLAEETFTIEVEPFTCPGALPPRLAPGMIGRVVPGSSANRVRSSGSVSATQVATISPGDIFEVLDGPVCADGFTWFQIRYDGTVGWTVEGDNEDYWLEPVDEASDCPSALPTRLAVGMDGYVSYNLGLVLRAGPAPGFDSIANADNLPLGTEFQIINGPECAGSILYWEVQISPIQTGWLAEGADYYFITPQDTEQAYLPTNYEIDCPFAPDTQLAIGEQTIIAAAPSGGLTLWRDEATSQIIGNLPADTELVILGGPICSADSTILRWYVRVLNGRFAGTEGWTSEATTDARWIIPASGEDEIVE